MSSLKLLSKSEGSVMAVSEFEAFKKTIITKWEKRRLPSFIKNRALKVTELYYPDSKEKYIIAWMQFGKQVYVIDLLYSYNPKWLKLMISELPSHYSKLKDWSPLHVKLGRIVYKYEVELSKERDGRESEDTD